MVTLRQEKYEAPMTSAQEVGWFYEPLVKPNPKFQHNLVLGDAPTFAESACRVYRGTRVAAHGGVRRQSCHLQP